MASLPLVDPFADYARRDKQPTIRLKAARPVATLSDLEWSVVAMGETDSIASLREPGRIGKMFGRMFGVRTANRLANERLEAIRRLAVLAWHHRWNVPKSEIANFLEAGFTLDHYELIQNRIGQARTARTRRGAR